MRRLWHAGVVWALLLVCGSAVSGKPQIEKSASGVDTSRHDQKNASLSTSAHESKPQTVQVELTSTIHAKKAKAGDPVKARTVTALVLPGQVVIPEGTKVIGHVTRAKAATGAGNAVVTIAFDHFEARNREVLAAEFSIRSGAMYERPARRAEADDEMTEAPPAGRTSTTPNNPSKPSKMTSGGMSNSTEAQVERAQSQSRSQQPPLKAQNAGDNHSDMRAITKGTLVGMPGVALRLDEASGAATFESANRNLELKSGLQLVLSVEAARAAAPAMGGSLPK